MPWPLLPGGTVPGDQTERVRRFRTSDLPIGAGGALLLALLTAHARLDARVAIPLVVAVAVLGWRAAVAFTSVARRSPRACALVDTVVLLLAGTASAAASFESETALWIAYIGLAQALALLHGPAIVTAMLVPAVPLATGLAWQLSGAQRFLAHAPGLVLVALSAVTTYLFLSRNNRLSVDYRDQLHEQVRRAAADEERRRIRGQVHVNLERALDEIERLEDLALETGGDAASRAYERARAALNELRAAVNGLSGETIDGLTLEGLARRRLRALCEPREVELRLALQAREVPVARAYHLLKLLDAVAAGSLIQGASELAVRVDWLEELHVEVAAESVSLDEGLAPSAHLEGLGARVRTEGGRLSVEAGPMPVPAAAELGLAVA